MYDPKFAAIVKKRVSATRANVLLSILRVYMYSMKYIDAQRELDRAGNVIILILKSENNRNVIYKYFAIKRRKKKIVFLN